MEYIKKCFEKKEPLERSMHNQTMLLFHQYMLVGGMPMPVVAFIENKRDFTEADKEKRDILKLYRDDFSHNTKKELFLKDYRKVVTQNDMRKHFSGCRIP